MSYLKSFAYVTSCEMLLLKYSERCIYTELIQFYTMTGQIAYVAQTKRADKSMQAD